MDPRSSTTATVNVVELVRNTAELIVEDAYDRGRSRGYLDLGGSRRRSALRRLEDLLDRDLTAVRVPAPTLRRVEVADALERVAARRLGRSDLRGGRAASTRNALRRAAVELGEAYPHDGTGESSLELMAAALRRVGVEGMDLERIRSRARNGRTVEA